MSDIKTPFKECGASVTIDVLTWDVSLPTTRYEKDSLFKNVLWFSGAGSELIVLALKSVGDRPVSIRGEDTNTTPIMTAKRAL
ncbi:MAG: hypothetical protein N3D12_01595 [Candidatus Methanomethyliaceae archaeon]|nr:hypothetical protein [Candidatus Methanomethyliaceae archaeon]